MTQFPHWSVCVGLLLSALAMSCAALDPEGSGDEPSALGHETPSESVDLALESCGSACSACILAQRTDILPFYASSGWDTSCANRDSIISNWCSIDPSGCGYVRAGACQANCGSVVCGSACSACVLAQRTDILPFYASYGWDTSCANRDNIVNSWCGIDSLGCGYAKAITCGTACRAGTQ